MSDHLFSESDRKYIMELIKDEWDFLHQKKKEVALLFVPRKELCKQDVSLEDYLKDEHSIYEVIDRMLSSKYSNIPCEQVIPKEEIQLLVLSLYDDIISKQKEKEEEYYKEVGNDFLNKYGDVSIFLLLGSLFISLGVIITIISVLRG